MKLKHLPGMVIIMVWTALLGLVVGLVCTLLLPFGFPWMAIKDTKWLRREGKDQSVLWFIPYMKQKWF